MSRRLSKATGRSWVPDMVFMVLCHGIYKGSFSVWPAPDNVDDGPLPGEESR